MAVKTLLVDDLDGTEAKETVTFSFHGITYEIDLNEENIKKMKEDFFIYTEAGRAVSNVPPARAKTTKSKQDGPSATEVREWAKENGMHVNEKGRVPIHIIQRYQAAHDLSAAA